LEAHGDGASTSYRYHPLFHAYLRREAAKEVSPDRAAVLRRRAAKLLEDGGQIEIAVELLFENQDHAEVARLLIEAAPALSARGQDALVASWIARLPESLREQDPWLLFWSGTALLGRDIAESKRRLEAADARFRPDTLGSLMAVTALTQAIVFEGADFSPLD